MNPDGSITQNDIVIFKNLLNEKGKIAIITHIFPDPDAISSALTLYKIYQKNNKLTTNIKVFIEGHAIGNLQKIPYINKIIFTEDIYSSIREFKPNAIVLTDINHINRLTLKDSKPLERYIKTKKLYVFDHHITKGLKPRHSVQKPFISNTELIYKLMVKAHVQIPPSIYTLIAIGMISDSGLCTKLPADFECQINFFKTLSHIIEKTDKNLQDIMKISDISITYEMHKYIKILLQNLKITPELSFTYAKFPNMETYNNIFLINRSILFFLLKVIESSTSLIKFIFYQINNMCFLSLRSNELNVESVARRLGGGGHTHMAGATFNCPNKTDFQKYLNIIKKQAKDLIEHPKID